MSRPASGRDGWRAAVASVVAGTLGVAGVGIVAVALSRQVSSSPQVPQRVASASAVGGPGRAEAPAAVPPTPSSRSTSPSPSPGPATALPPGTTEQSPQSWKRGAVLGVSVPVHVRIPRIGVDADMVRLGLGADGEMEVPVGPEPVGWYDHSPTPGQVGPSVLAAHVTWNGARGAFFGLATLRAGDRIVVDRADRSRAVFVVRDVAQYPKSQFPTQAVYGSTPGATLRLITCAGEFDAAAHHYADNAVVYADLVAPSA